MRKEIAGSNTIRADIRVAHVENGKGKANPITGLNRPLGFQQVEAPIFYDSLHMKMARLSALLTGRLYP
jgi:hypothetical protein